VCTPTIFGKRKNPSGFSFCARQGPDIAALNVEGQYLLVCLSSASFHLSPSLQLRRIRTTRLSGGAENKYFAELQKICTHREKASCSEKNGVGE
jgi:hypothetical protein